MPHHLNWKRRFFTIWIGQAFSLTTSHVVQFAIIWWLTAKTNSPLVMSIASNAGFLPQIIVGPLAGVLVDRWNRKRVMMIADSAIALSTLVLVVLFLFGVEQIWHIYIILALRSLGSAFHWPAQESSTALLVPSEHLTRVAGLHTMLYSASKIIAPIVAAFLIDELPIYLVLSLDILGAIIANILLGITPVPQPKRIDNEIAKPHIMKEMISGFKYLWHKRAIFVLTVACMLICLFEAPPTSFTSLLVNRHFGITPHALGYVSSALGVGTFAGSILLSIWGGFKKGAKTVLMACIIMGIAFFSMGLLPDNALISLIIATIALGTSGALFYGPFTSLLQKEIDPAYQGRVLSLVQSMLWLVYPFSLAISGPVAEHTGVRFWFVLSGIAIVIISLVCFQYKPLFADPKAITEEIDPPNSLE